jgi:hypothetical protein
MPGRRCGTCHIVEREEGRESEGEARKRGGKDEDSVVVAVRVKSKGRERMSLRRDERVTRPPGCWRLWVMGDDEGGESTRALRARVGVRPP